MAYKKPQYPLKNGEDYIYPVTTGDQVILSDGSRLEKNGVVEAGRLNDAKEIALTGDVTGSVSFDGSNDVTIDTFISSTDLGFASVSHTHDDLVSSDCGNLTWGGDYTISASSRPDNKLHFGTGCLYRYNQPNNQYYSIYDSEKLSFSLSGSTLTITTK